MVTLLVGSVFPVLQRFSSLIVQCMHGLIYFSVRALLFKHKVAFRQK